MPWSPQHNSTPLPIPLPLPSLLSDPQRLNLFFYRLTTGESPLPASILGLSALLIPLLPALPNRTSDSPSEPGMNSASRGSGVGVFDEEEGEDEDAKMASGVEPRKVEVGRWTSCGGVRER